MTGGFLAGLYHGTGTSYFRGGLVTYQGEFFQGLRRAPAAFTAPPKARLLRPRCIRAISIMPSLVDATLAVIETMFAETPVINYCGNECVYVYAEQKNRPRAQLFRQDVRAGSHHRGGDRRLLKYTSSCRIEASESLRGQEPIGRTHRDRCRKQVGPSTLAHVSAAPDIPPKMSWFFGLGLAESGCPPAKRNADSDRGILRPDRGNPVPLEESTSEESSRRILSKRPTSSITKWTADCLAVGGGARQDACAGELGDLPSTERSLPFRRTRRNTTTPRRLRSPTVSPSRVIRTVKPTSFSQYHLRGG
jgi:hypothetical protein